LFYPSDLIGSLVVWATDRLFYVSQTPASVAQAPRVDRVDVWVLTTVSGIDFVARTLFATIPLYKLLDAQSVILRLPLPEDLTRGDAISLVLTDKGILVFSKYKWRELFGKVPEMSFEEITRALGVWQVRLAETRQATSEMLNILGKLV
jgi:hypothetical protein